MNALAFFDTNILIYADDQSDPEKQSKSIQLITSHQREGLLVISLQVMQEYFVALTKKLRVDPQIAQRKVEILARGNVVRLGPDDVIAAIELHRLSQISFWDAMIVHAARRSGAAVLYTEDLRHGSVLGGVLITNPFLEETQ